MCTSEIRTVINKLQTVRQNAKLLQYLDAEQAQAIHTLQTFLERLNKGELVIEKQSRINELILNQREMD